MSHFTVLVVADDEEHLAERLAPYQEEASVEFTEFTDMTDEWIEESKHVITRAEDKSIVENHPEAEGKTLLEFYGQGDFETYVAEWHGGHDTEEGRYGYRINPNVKWDWYEIGGRWKDEVIKGDTCLVKDFNKTKVQAKQRLAAEQEWDDVHDIFDELGISPAARQKAYEGNWDAFRKEEIENSARSVGKKTPDRWKLFQFKPNGTTKEEHAAKAELDPSTSAIVDRDGEWIQEGKMGWFGCASNVDKDGYRKAFWEAMDELSPDDRLYVVDCHI